jgi:endoglucanase
MLALIGFPLPRIVTAMALPQGRWGVTPGRSSPILLALVLLAALLAPLSGPASADGFVRADGTRFVNPDGSTFPVKGISLGNWLMQEGYMFRFGRAKSPRQIEALVERLVGPEEAAAFWAAFRDGYVTKADVDFIAAAGFTTIRVPLHFKLFVDPADPARFDGPGWALVERLVGWCREAGLKVILDLHAAPGGQTGVNHDDGPGYPVMFYVPAHRRLTVALWTEIARRFRDDTTVLGYDLLNEPISPYHDTGYLNPRLEPFYRELVEAIRAVDPNHPIILAGAQWSTSFSMLGPPFADNLAYTYHKFWASTARDGVQEYVNFMALYDVPVFVGETGELTDDWNARFRALNERFGIGWSFWPYKYMETTSAVISVQKPAGWETIVAASALTPDEWTDAALPPREEARAALAAYLEAIQLENGRVNAGYLESLGLRVPVPR